MGVSFKDRHTCRIVSLFIVIVCSIHTFLLGLLKRARVSLCYVLLNVSLVSDECEKTDGFLILVGTVVRSVVVVVRFLVQHFGIVVHYHAVFEQRSSYRSGLVVLHC